jgi:hypothetical protein
MHKWVKSQKIKLLLVILISIKKKDIQMNTSAGNILKSLMVYLTLWRLSN